MNKNDKKQLIETIENEFKEEISKVSEQDKKACNVFNILGCGNDELKHSYFLRWMLYNDAFFKRFLAICDINLTPEQLSETRRIKKEESYNIDEIHEQGIPISKELYDENESRRRIDLNIIADTYSITIENKVDSSEHNDQCISYYNYMMDTEGKYGKRSKIKNKFFVFLAKNDVERYEERGGLIRKKGENIVEKDVSLLISNLRTIANEKNSNESRKELVNKLANSVGDRDKILKKITEIDMEIDKTNPKMLYFNYRLFNYAQIKNILNQDDFEMDFIDEFKKTNVGWKENDIIFVKEILKQYKNLIEEWIVLPERYKIIFKELNDEQENYLFKINENYNDLYIDEEDSDTGRFLEVAKRYYLEKKSEMDNTIEGVLLDLAKDRENKNLNLYSYSNKYARSITAQNSPLTKYIKTIDYAALNNISVRMIAGLSTPTSNNLLKYIKLYIKDEQFAKWYDKCKNVGKCRVKMGWALRKSQENKSGSYDISFIEYNIDQILKCIDELQKEDRIDTLFPLDSDKKIFVDKFYINYDERIALVKAVKEKKKEEGKKTKEQKKFPLMLKNQENRLVSFINDNSKYINNADKTIEEIIEYQKNNYKVKGSERAIFATEFELHVIFEYEGDKDNKDEIKDFFERATEIEVQLFGANKDDIFKYK